MAFLAIHSTQTSPGQNVFVPCTVVRSCFYFWHCWYVLLVFWKRETLLSFYMRGLSQLTERLSLFFLHFLTHENKTCCFSLFRPYAGSAGQQINPPSTSPFTTNTPWPPDLILHHCTWQFASVRLYKSPLKLRMLVSFLASFILKRRYAVFNNWLEHIPAGFKRLRRSRTPGASQPVRRSRWQRCAALLRRASATTQSASSRPNQAQTDYPFDLWYAPYWRFLPFNIDADNHSSHTGITPRGKYGEL